MEDGSLILHGTDGQSFFKLILTDTQNGFLADPIYGGNKDLVICGTSGQAGNIKGQIQAGGNPFEGPRSRPAPTPPQKQGFGHTLFAEAASQLGNKPFPQPSGNLSRAYTNPLGVTPPMYVLRLLRMVRLRQLFQG